MSASSPKRRKAVSTVQRGRKRAQLSELSRHLLRAQEEERKRMSRELHDGTGQGLMVLRLYLGMLASDSQSPESQLKIHEALKLLDHTIEDLRRIISRLSPRILDELGLLPAIRKEVRDFAKNTDIEVQLDLPKSVGTLDHELEVAIYRSLQEALHNIAKHSRAQTFAVRLELDESDVRLWVEDDGVGFTAKRFPEGAFGLTGMKERVAALDGTVQVRSGKGHGTQLKIVLPVAQGARTHAVAGRHLPLIAEYPASTHSSWLAEQSNN